MPLGLTDAQVIAAVGFLLPLLIAVVKRAALPNSVNAIIALVTYVITAVIVTFVQGGAFQADTFVQNFILVFSSGTIGYVALWKNNLDPVITAKVNGGTAPAP
jgi:TctA family transporter